MKKQKATILLGTIISFIMVTFFLGLPSKSLASLAGKWSLPLSTVWKIDPRFDFGTPYSGSLHLGEDVEVPAGTPVFASANGKVVGTYNLGGFHNWGGLILVEHQNIDGKKVTSLYGHLDARTFKVSVGQIINRGQLLGSIGTYESNGGWNEHLHFGIRQGGFVSSPWVYTGFGDNNTLKKWVRPHIYIAAKTAIKEAARLPLYSRNRYETAVGVSHWRFPNEQSVDTAILVNGQSYASGIVATPLTKQLNAPLLLTDAHHLPSTSQQEIQRVLKPSGHILIVGSQTFIDNSIQQQLQNGGYSVERLTADTPEELSLAVIAKLPVGQQAFLVSKEKFADGISAGAPATTFSSPILLSDAQHLSAPIASYLSNHPQIKNIIIAGGPAALSKQIEDDLTNINAQLHLERIGGPNRYYTSRFMAERFFAAPKLIAAVTGENYPDSLAGASLAASAGGSLVLARHNKISAYIPDYLRAVANSVNVGLVLGGPAALTNQVDIDLGSALNAPLILNNYTPGNEESGWTLNPWSTKGEEKIDGLTLPQSPGYMLSRSTYHGATVFSYRTNQAPTASKNDVEELNRAPVITKLKLHGNSVEQTLTSWFNATTKIKSTNRPNIYSVTSYPSLFPGMSAAIQKGSGLILIEVPLQTGADQILQHLININT